MVDSLTRSSSAAPPHSGVEANGGREAGTYYTLKVNPRGQQETTQNFEI